MTAPALRSITETRSGALASSLERMLSRVRLRARRRAAWLQHLWSSEGDPGGGLVITESELVTYLDDHDSPALEIAWLAAEPSMAPWNAALAEVEATMAADTASPLSQLVRLFDLNSQESDLLQACLALELDPALARVYAYVQDHAGRGYVTAPLIARLFGHGRTLIIAGDSPLRLWRIMTEDATRPGEPSALTCDDHILGWLLGCQDLDARLVGSATYRPPRAPLADWSVEATVAHLKDLLDREDIAGVRMTIAGVPGSGRRTFAADVAEQMGRRLLVVETGRVAPSAWDDVYIHAQRQCHLDGCALAWHGNLALTTPWPQHSAPVPVQFVIAEEDAMPAPPLAGVIDERLVLPPLSLAERRRLWAEMLPVAAAWPPDALETLVQQHRVTVGEIVSTAQSAACTPAAVTEHVRSAQRHRLEELAQPLACPFHWDDIVIPHNLREALDDFVFEAQTRAPFWEQDYAQRLFPQGRGLIALLSGPPGTGKTMAAQIIAATLGLDLFRIDLAAVVSKYVGETSQNLERILRRAAHMDVVLFFDEADALFGKRTEIHDAHDRFANTDTGYLLQAIEGYQGVALLATNKKHNIDSAFIRRLRYVLEFPRPDATQRLRIWQRLVTELTDDARTKTLNGTLEALAESVDTTGAQIKLAVLSALFAARRDGAPLAMHHLVRGLNRELMKEGRALSTRERERLLSNGR